MYMFLIILPIGLSISGWTIYEIASGNLWRSNGITKSSIFSEKNRTRAAKATVGDFKALKRFFIKRAEQREKDLRQATFSTKKFLKKHGF